MILASIFAVLTAVGARISFHIGTVPLTLQLLFTLLAGALLGAKAGAISQLIYIMMGLAGLPVFAGGGGPQYVLAPSFGYALGFAAAAFVVGLICEKNGKYIAVLGACLAGVLIAYVFGIVYMYLIYDLRLGMGKSFLYIVWIGTGVLIWKDIALCFFAAWLAVRLKAVTGRAFR